MSCCVTKNYYSPQKEWILLLTTTEIRRKTQVRQPYCNLYAYGANNPVRYIDPDGETPVKPNTKIGQQAHTFFEDQLAIILVGKQAASNRTAYSDRPLNRIMNFLFRQMGVDTRNQVILAEQDPAVDELSAPQKRPDLVITNSIDKTITVYELKPDSCRTGYKNTKAKAQIAGYITDLSKNSSFFSLSLFRLCMFFPSKFTKHSYIKIE